MPNYWNSGNFYPTLYPQYGYSSAPVMPQQSYTAPVSNIAAAWVEGEMEARGRQIPQGVTQYFMFDANQKKIYLKSINQMGMPNPMQVLNFTIEEQPQGNISSGQSGNYSGSPDMSQYVTKQDLEQLKNEIRTMNQSGMNSSTNNGYSGNQNGSANNSGQSNRGGNR